MDCRYPTRLRPPSGTVGSFLRGNTVGQRGRFFSLSQIFAYAPALVTPALIVVFSTVVVAVISAILQIRVSEQQMELASKESGMSYALI